MKISVFGLGCVGAVNSACLASQGHEIIGVDIDKNKIDFINQGKSPLYEPGLDELIQTQVNEKRLKAITDVHQAVTNTDISIICVGTPSTEIGGLELGFVENILTQIATVIRMKDKFHVVVMRSTVLPGTAKKVAIPILEHISGKKVGVDFGYVSNPEFLRESTSIFDFFNPPKIVIGHSDEISGSLVSELYNKLENPLILTGITEAEMVKYADNAWHATKVVFANEIGCLAKEVGIDGQKVMDIFCLDKKLNLSSYYMKPAFAFGGSCLAKDVRAINVQANELNVRVPLLDSLIKSNHYQIERAYNMIVHAKKNKIAILGISFKADTDDIRESPQLMLVEKLSGKGYEIQVYDSNVSNTLKTGANKEMLGNRIKHVVHLIRDSLDEVLENSEIIVIANESKEFEGLADKLCADKIIVDLVRNSEKVTEGNYMGICW